jgi:CRISPR-associated protein Cmr3
MSRTILIEPRDPVIFRDGKPSLAGLPIRSMEWPMPSAVAGAIRTRLGRATNYDDATVRRLLEVRHLGPLPAIHNGAGWQLAVPAPADAVVFRDGGQLTIEPLRPARLKDSDGADAPDGLAPVLMKATTRNRPHRGKPYEDLTFWKLDDALEWLGHAGSDTFDATLGRFGYEKLPSQRRVHLEVNDETQAAEEGALFSTEGLEFAKGPDREPPPHELGDIRRVAICSRVESGDGWAPIEGFAPLGGERRLAHWWEEEVEWGKPPGKLLDGLVRLQLLTPAYFLDGWKPRWLNEGAPKGVEGLRLKLIAAALPRAVAHSGWDMSKPAGTPAEKRAKPARFLVPAGSVYFFEAQGDARQLWLKSISEGEREPNEGFGLVLVGEWKWLSDYY